MTNVIESLVLLDGKPEPDARNPVQYLCSIVSGLPGTAVTVPPASNQFVPTGGFGEP